MTAGSPPVLRTVAFAEQDPGVWGAVWSLVGAPFVLLGSGSSVVATAAQLDGAEPASDWTVRGEELDLTLSGDLEHVLSVNGRFDQACRASGRFRLGGEELEVDCAGYRGARASDGELDRFDSIRGVAAMFENGEAIGLIAVRPRRAKGHGADAVTAALLAPEAAVAVEDPRLSTTYATDGRPARASLELWIGREEGEQQRLRRASGEALGPSATGGLGDLQATGELFRWHSRGETGVGVYLLARHR